MRCDSKRMKMVQKYTTLKNLQTYTVLIKNEEFLTLAINSNWQINKKKLKKEYIVNNHKKQTLAPYFIFYTM